MDGLPNELMPDPHVLQSEWSQIGDHRLTTLCGVVEWLGHYRGDDLVEIHPTVIEKSQPERDPKWKRLCDMLLTGSR